MDPFVSLEDHGPAVANGNIIYGGNAFGGRQASTVLPMHEGANVFCMLEQPPSHVGNGVWNFNNAQGIGSDRWKLVRRVKAGNAWHPATDQLAGTESYGEYSNDFRVSRCMA